MTVGDKILINEIKRAKRDNKGRYYHYVPSSIRRNNRKIIPLGDIKRMIKAGYITEQDLPK